MKKWIGAPAWRRNPAVRFRSAQGATLLAVFLATAVCLAEPPTKSCPIGVFDSGTGGLAVLEQILNLDLFDNQTGRLRETGDGRPDFEHERFIFLADQANMPYGNYPVVGKQRFLVELVENDAEFLLGNEYFSAPAAPAPSTDKQPAKAIVIACNTATAYGKTAIESLVARAEPDVEVIGVIEAAALGALEALQEGPPGTIGVLATEGTVASGAYPKTIAELARRGGHRQPPCVVQQGAYGLAGAIDGARELIVANVADDRPRLDYRGPTLTNPLAPIDRQLLPRYQFDFSAHRVLWEGDRDRPRSLQINSVENYIAYHLVSLLEKIRAAPDPRPLTVVILGCTHFPFYTDSFRAQLARLHDYRENGAYVYRPCLAADVRFIDPAVHVGRELYQRLAGKKQLAESTGAPPKPPRGEFYITVPRRDHPGVQLDPSGWFTYDYKYGRGPDDAFADVRAVPWDQRYLEPEVTKRLARQAPTVWGAIRQFNLDRAEREKNPPGHP
ncbi:MAG: aspartate/glutamate racemase family protein [Pirellulales bacterium]|nr:aspartate/glutamate racemase family protein [Thermoguttaceae bacterium]MDD4787819.1 aspartate/glutamate racemase family protein [Pirellulales bacterium]MDI9445252.1 aspartate/glutamate racemase family protein [Planctomycetota bacterium]NLZ02475.1 Asp/Glu/hydantoin racemase [Pirellulaceae bacterium]